MKKKNRLETKMKASVLQSVLQQEVVLIPPKSISDQIYEVLKERISLGIISPGERIIENSIASDLKTSRTPVREAFQRLVQDGLAERVPQGGVRVTVIAPRMVREVFGIRAVLEVYAIESACDQINGETLGKLKELAGEARRLLSSPEANQLEGLTTLWKINTAFHETIYRSTGSEYLLKLIDQLNSLVRRFRFLSMRKTRKRAWDQHEMIVKYLEEKNKEALRELIKAHVEDAASDTLKALENDQWERDV